ncbi:hypothetical protein PR048_029216 [Dryococelus australis]|uniref:Uncharacterized protein n=1 Tax=Dryococelus australis TaxID=614101 RepID=A0ABQ9GCS5_9NEOP|nr:hypothetical protein PR048_029216 [Dryococelus australis]
MELQRTAVARRNCSAPRQAATSATDSHPSVDLPQGQVRRAVSCKTTFISTVRNPSDANRMRVGGYVCPCEEVLLKVSSRAGSLEVGTNSLTIAGVCRQDNPVLHVAALQRPAVDTTFRLRCGRALLQDVLGSPLAFVSGLGTKLPRLHSAGVKRQKMPLAHEHRVLSKTEVKQSSYAANSSARTRKMASPASNTPRRRSPTSALHPMLARETAPPVARSIQADTRLVPEASREQSDDGRAHIKGTDVPFRLRAFICTVRSSGGAVARALASHHGDPGPIPGGFTSVFSHVVIVLDDAACRRVFSRHSRFPCPCIPAPLHTSVSFHVMSGDDGHLRVQAGKPVTRRVLPRPGFTSLSMLQGTDGTCAFASRGRDLPSWASVRARQVNDPVRNVRQALPSSPVSDVTCATHIGESDPAGSRRGILRARAANSADTRRLSALSRPNFPLTIGRVSLWEDIFLPGCVNPNKLSPTLSVHDSRADTCKAWQIKSSHLVRVSEIWCFGAPVVLESFRKNRFVLKRRKKPRMDYTSKVCRRRNSVGFSVRRGVCFTEVQFSRANQRTSCSPPDEDTNGRRACDC